MPSFPQTHSLTQTPSLPSPEGLIWMDNLYCRGTEHELRHCPFDGWAVHDCEANEVAGVVCDDRITLLPRRPWGNRRPPSSSSSASPPEPLIASLIPRRSPAPAMTYDGNGSSVGRRRSEPSPSDQGIRLPTASSSSLTTATSTHRNQVSHEAREVIRMLIR